MLDQKLDQILDMTAKVQARQDEIGKKEAEKDLAIKQLTDQITSLAQEKQDEKIKTDSDKKALEDSIKSIEAEIKRTGLGNNSSKKENSVVYKFKSEFANYARKAGKTIDEALINEYHSTIVDSFAEHASVESREVLIKALSVDSNPDGGYLVFPEKNPNVQNIREFETSPMRSVATVITTIAESYEEVIDDDESESGGWVSEREERKDTGTPQFGKLVFATHEQYAQPLVTQKMLDDSSINIESYLSGKTNDIVTRTENTAFVSGNGAGKPKGFLSYEAWAANGSYERGKLEQIKSGTNGAYVADTIKTLQNSLKGRYQAKAVFMGKRDDWGRIILLKDGQGNYLLDPRSFKNGDTLTLLGKPFVFADDMQASVVSGSPVTGALSLSYGDFNAGYIIVDRFGLRVLRDPYTSKPYVKFYTTKRVGGGVKNFEAIKNYKLSA